MSAFETYLRLRRNFEHERGDDCDEPDQHSEFLETRAEAAEEVLADFVEMAQCSYTFTANDRYVLIRKAKLLLKVPQ